MFTPPEGESPIMQMYLWRSPFRTVSSGSDAAVLYHEYTHGLSNRLVVDADGIGALNTAQAGAMGEGWSDWYAQDFLVGQFPALDTGEAGEVDMGAYVNARSRLRSSPLDCPVGGEPGRLPGARGGRLRRLHLRRLRAHRWRRRGALRRRDLGAGPVGSARRGGRPRRRGRW